MSNLDTINSLRCALLDTSGQRCPVPIMRTKTEFSKLRSGEKVLIVATDPSFDLDCRVFIRQSGHILLQSWEEVGKFYFLLQKQSALMRS